MHEWSIVQSLIERTAAEARRHKATRVDRLHVQIGELSGVEIELLTRAYETFRDRTICADAELEVERIAAHWSCPRCGRPPVGHAPLRCPDCDVPLRMTQGDEIVLERIEMEVA
jgi:hydrogenase nickel incorporation protein HypA/HybF